MRVIFITGKDGRQQFFERCYSYCRSRQQIFERYYFGSELALTFNKILLSPLEVGVQSIVDVEVLSTTGEFGTTSTELGIAPSFCTGHGRLKTLELYLELLLGPNWGSTESKRHRATKARSNHPAHSQHTVTDSRLLSFLKYKILQPQE